MTFLLDLGAERDNRAIPDSVHYTPDPQRFPHSGFFWKIVCDADGTVSIRVNVGGKLRLIAAAHWDGTLETLRQRDPNVPTGPQWGFVTAALEAELIKRLASGEPADPDLLDPISDEDARYLKGADPAKLDTTNRYTTPVQSAAKPNRGLTPPWIALFIAMAAVTIVVMVKRDKQEAAPPPTPAPVEVAPTAMPTPAPPPPSAPIEAQVAAAPSFSAAIALAKNDASGTLLARYPKLTWAEVDGPAETSIGHVQKDAEAERGKRMCTEGVIEKIERTDVDRRKVFVGRLRQADGDVVAFTALGTTGDLVKRSSAKFCGAVTGANGDDVALVGLFDLPENRSPIVEQ